MGKMKEVMVVYGISKGLFKCLRYNYKCRTDLNQLSRGLCVEVETNCLLVHPAIAWIKQVDSSSFQHIVS